MFNTGHLDSINHSQFDPSQEQSRRNNVKARIQSAEKGYDVIQKVKGNNNDNRVDTQENDFLMVQKAYGHTNEKP